MESGDAGRTTKEGIEDAARPRGVFAIRPMAGVDGPTEDRLLRRTRFVYYQSLTEIS
jgi:hypothetical protein